MKSSWNTHRSVRYDGRICEPWSVEIARHLLPEGELVEPRLV